MHAPFNRLSFLITAAVCWTAQVSALSVPIKRANDYGLTNFNDVVYAVKLNVAGTDFTVSLDTGSPDTWVDIEGMDSGSVKKLEETGKAGKIDYADNSRVSGPIVKAEVTLGGFKVANQALIADRKSSASQGIVKGLVGLGPNSRSDIQKTLDGTAHDGRTLMSSIFKQAAAKDHFVSFALSRVGKGKGDGGVFTINEILPQFSSVKAEPKLTVDPESEKWLVNVPEVEINGKKFTDDVGAALIDTGSSYASGPQELVDAIYKDVPGAKYVENSGRYSLPCDAMVNVTFNFGGKAIPIHPIDAIATGNSDSGSTTCYGTIKYWSKPREGFKWILGGAFLRNVYAVFDYGSFEDGISDDPFIQVLPITDIAKAKDEFPSLMEQRLGNREAY